MTIKDIARESGYAVSTVSRALNDHPDVSEETKAKIRAVVARTGFVPNSNARQLKASQSRSVIVIVEGAFNVFFANILERIQQYISGAGYVAEVHYIDENANEVAVAAQLQREYKPLGILFLGGNVANFSNHFDEITVPCVLATTFSRQLVYPHLSQVSVDDMAAGAAACRYLMQKGHRSIGVIGGDRETSFISKLRYAGFCEAYLASGRPHPPELYQRSSFSVQSGYKTMRQLLAARPDLTAVFCMSDMVAIGAIRAVLDEGLRVPEDISVLGFDGIDLGQYTTPRLCTLRQPQKQLADESVARLVEQIEKGARGSICLLDTTLVAGESVAAVRG